MNAVITFPKINRPGHEADCLRPSRAGVENEWIYTSTLAYAFIANTGTNSPSPYGK
jgi:hypothetical protein